MTGKILIKLFSSVKHSSHFNGEQVKIFYPMINHNFNIDRDEVLRRNKTTSWTRFFGGTSELEFQKD